VNGIFVVNSTNLTLLPNTSGMVYPSWYPDCQYIAADVGENAQITGEHVTARINAVSGEVTAAPLANDSVWAGFPSVNQVDPRLISFAGQFKGKANYYNELLNYTWVTDRSTSPSRVRQWIARRLPAQASCKNFRRAPVGSARSRVRAQSTGQYRNAGLHRSLIERSRGSRVAAYGD
jgi:hypothetical protein